MKIKNIRLILFAIAVMKIRLGKSRLFMKPNFWIMENGEDPKGAVLDLNPAVQGFDQDGWAIESGPPQYRVDSKDPFGSKLVPMSLKKTLAPRLMVFHKGK